MCVWTFVSGFAFGWGINLGQDSWYQEWLQKANTLSEESALHSGWDSVTGSVTTVDVDEVWVETEV